MSLTDLCADRLVGRVPAATDEQEVRSCSSVRCGAVISSRIGEAALTYLANIAL